MEEKKLTYDEIIRDLNYAIEVGGDIETPPNEMLAFIERLQAENERLTEEKNDWEKSCRMWSEANKKNHLKFTKTLEKLCEERNKNAELQKQVDYLTKAKDNALLIIEQGEKQILQIRQQAVKDTAREIYDKVEEIWLGCHTTCVLSQTIERWIKERYGVEVK